MTTLDRIYLVIDEKCNGSQMAFSKSLGMSQTTINSQLSRYKRVSFDVIAKTLNVFSDISAEWLMRGAGSMYRASEDSTIPLIPTSAIGGAMVGLASDGNRLEDCERVVSPFANADYAIQVHGESMAPEYPNGSRIFIKKIKEGSFLKWGEVYVLDTCNGAVIKEVQPSENEGFITCISLNPNGRYKPFDVDKNDIYGIYAVLGCLTIK